MIESRFTVNGKRYSVYADTVSRCKEKESLVREQIKNGTYTNNRNITLDQYYDEWEKGRRGTIKGNTALGNKSRYKNHIKPAIGNRKIVDIEKREIIKLQQELSEKMKATTANAVITQLKTMLNDAVSDGILSQSPARGVKALKTEEKEASKTYHRALTVEEQNMFLQEAKCEWLYELLALMLCTGMRIGEATALTWSDIDYINNVIHVTSTISRTSEGSYTVGTPKSKKSKRDIPMTGTIKDILKSQKQKIKDMQGNVIDISQRVFMSISGGMVYNASANKAITDTLKRMESKGNRIEHFSAHALRDTFATRYIEHGGSPQVLKTILGHASLAMTMDLYSHVMPNTKQEEMEKINIAFSSVTG